LLPGGAATQGWGRFVIQERWRAVSALGAVVSVCLVAGCTTQGKTDDIKTSSIGKTSGKAYAYTARDRECLARAMFFESNRSSRAGLVAVGTVVMNRLHSDRYPDTVCGVVGQKGQFAPGVLSRRMNSKALPDVQDAADAVLRGERHPAIGKAMFFHQAGLKFPYKNMHYVLTAGGHSFYEKRSRRSVPKPQVETEIASVETPDIPALSYKAAKPEDADAIGALILAQDRPAMD
jgi:spore germination cell wall hydrolase CwlJ-like protein